MRNRYFSLELGLVFFLLVSVQSVVWTLDASVDLSFGQNTVKTMIPTTNGFVPFSYKTYQIGFSATLSQDIGDQWKIRGLVGGSDILTTNTNGTYPRPEMSSYQAGVTFSPIDMFQFDLAYHLDTSVTIEYGVYAVTMAENEPEFSVTWNAPFDLDWFYLGAVLTAGYYFSPYSKGFGFSLNLIPEFSVTNWSLSVSLPMVLGFSMTGFKGATETWFDSFAPGISVSWTLAEVLTFGLSLGYNLSLSRDSSTRFLNSSPYFQVSASFQVNGPEPEDTTNGENAGSETNSAEVKSEN